MLKKNTSATSLLLIICQITISSILKGDGTHSEKKEKEKKKGRRNWLKPRLTRYDGCESLYDANLTHLICIYFNIYVF